MVDSSQILYAWIVISLKAGLIFFSSTILAKLKFYKRTSNFEVFFVTLLRGPKAYSSASSINGHKVKLECNMKARI